MQQFTPAPIRLVRLLLLGALALAGFSAVLSLRQPDTPPAPAKSAPLLEADSSRLQRLVQRNLDPSVSFPAALLDSCLATWRPLPVGTRVAHWAQFFLDQGRSQYLFGLAPGGYVAESLLVQDFRQDCVLFSYRCSELARARDAQGAILEALATRFAATSPDSVVSAAGGVNYDHPAHLDYSLDMVRSGRWGRDVTRDVGVAVIDSVGTSRYPGGSFSYIPSAQLRLGRLADGDLLYFVFDEKHPHGEKMRREYGLVIGHQGIVQLQGDTVSLIHAAQSDLRGEYRGKRIVRVPLATYLRRVDSFKGIIVTRLEDSSPASPAAPGG